MKKINWIIFFHTSVWLMSCYPHIGGYRGGRKYELVDSKTIYFDFSINSIYLIDRPKKDFTISFRKGDTLICHDGFSDTTKLKNHYQLPDSLISFSKEKKLSILVIVDYETYYELYITPYDWLKKKTIYGYTRQYKEVE